MKDEQLVERVATAIDGAAIDGCGDWREWVAEARAAIAAMPDAQRIAELEARVIKCDAEHIPRRPHPSRGAE